MRLIQVFRQLGLVVTTARPAHYLAALTAPARTLRAFKYHYRRIPEHDFVEFIVRAAGEASAAVDGAYPDLARHLCRSRESRDRSRMRPRQRRDVAICGH